MSSVWPPILAAFVGAAVGGIIGPILLDRYFRPRLKIERSTRPDGRLQLDDQRVFYRVFVTNDGKRGAKNCGALVTFRGIDAADVIDTSDAILKKSFFEEGGTIQDTSLCWTIGQPTITINPRAPAALDVVRLTKKQNREDWMLSVPSEEGWKKLRVLLRARAGTIYEGTLLVTAENADPCEARFEVTIQGDDAILHVL